MKENMEQIFLKIEEQVRYSLEKTDVIKMKEIFSSIKGATLISGVGGSSVVSNFLAKLLSKKNHIICEAITPRDVLYRDLNAYQNMICCSYSGTNLGVSVSFQNELNHYLFSTKKMEEGRNLNYEVKEMEHSFISLSSTLIPMTLALYYYCDDKEVIEEILLSKLDPYIYQENKKVVGIGYEEESFSEKASCSACFPRNISCYEIMSGYESKAAEKFLETTITEAGLGIPVVHDKYDYCHGRSNLTYQYPSIGFLFDCETELDSLYKSILSEYYDKMIWIKKKYEDEIINDYYFTYISMLLCKELAKAKEKDLSNVEYSKLVKKLYFYKGEM